MEKLTKADETCKRIANELMDIVEGKGDETLNEYLERKTLDVTYMCNGDGSYEAVRVFITTGGPSIYIDTNKRAIVLNGYQEYGEWYLNEKTVNLVDQIEEQYYYMAMESRFGGY